MRLHHVHVAACAQSPSGGCCQYKNAATLRARGSIARGVSQSIDTDNRRKTKNVAERRALFDAAMGGVAAKLAESYFNVCVSFWNYMLFDVHQNSISCRLHFTSSLA